MNTEKREMKRTIHCSAPFEMKDIENATPWQFILVEIFKVGNSNSFYIQLNL